MERLEDCLNGGGRYLLQFDASWTRTQIMKLASMGKLDYFPDFPRPFFRMRGAQGTEVKGVEGRSQCRVLLSSRSVEDFREQLVCCLANCRPGLGGE